MKIIVTIGILYLIFTSCNFNNEISPTSSDTITVKSDVALFYYPDSTSLDTLRNELNEKTYKEAINDYNHFMGLASVYFDSVKLKRLTTNRGKVLKFVRQDKSEFIIDTKTLVDFWGVILFNKNFKPKLIDITIIDLEYNRYFY